MRSTAAAGGMFPADPGPVGESLAETFWSVSRRLRRQAADALAPWDLTPGQARALGTLVRLGAMRTSTLAGHLRIAPRSATEVVDALVGRGFVARDPDPADRRATLLRATPDGVELATAVRAARTAGADRVFDVLAPADRAELTRLLGLLAGR